MFCDGKAIFSSMVEFQPVSSLYSRNMCKSCQEFAFWPEFGWKNLWSCVWSARHCTEMHQAVCLTVRQNRGQVSTRYKKVAGWQDLDGNQCSHQRRWYALKSWKNDCMMRKCLCGEKIPFLWDEHWTCRLVSLRSHPHFIAKSEGNIIVHIQGFSLLRCLDC